MTRWPRSAAAGLLTLAACATSPPHWQPEPPPSPLKIAPTGGAVRFGDADPGGAVWSAIGDERLARLIDELRRSSPDLRAAEARVRAARAVARRAASARKPSLDLAGDASVDRAGSVAGGDVESYEIAFEASWELDLFDRLAHARDAAAADADAIAEDRRALLLSLEAELALAWLEWRGAVGEEAVLLETASLFERTRDLVKARLEAGIGEEIAVYRIESDLATSRAELPLARLRGTRARHRVALLLGRPPDAEIEGPSAELSDLPPELPVGLPAALLRRRPDVRAAERRIEARHAGVREAWAAFWPTIVLDASAGVSSLDLGDLFTGSALFALLSPRLRVPLLSGGRLQAERLEQEALRDEAAAQWVALALRAFAEVADAATGVAARREALDRRREAVDAARRAVEAADSRFNLKLIGYLDVVESQRTLATVRLGLVREERDLRFELVRLARSLGGGWADEAAKGSMEGGSGAGPPPGR